MEQDPRFEGMNERQIEQMRRTEWRAQMLRDVLGWIGLGWAIVWAYAALYSLGKSIPGSLVFVVFAVLSFQVWNRRHH